MSIRRILVVIAALVVMLPIGTGRAEVDRNGDLYRQEWIPTADPLTEMHADVIRSAAYDWTERQPVILVATPYGNHAGQTGWGVGAPAEHNGRFSDFLELSGALELGYTYVVVDLPGYGGSSGCSDLGGPLERAAVKTAVEWAAAQPWSTGKVALFGKSYDGWTGLMGIAEQPKGLAAVVAMEPVYSPYTVDFSNGVRNTRSFLLPGVYANIEANPGTMHDDPRYMANSVIRPHCYAVNQAHWLNEDGSAAFWQERDLPSDSVGATTPLFMTQGLLESNTVSRGAFSYFNSLGYEGNQAWFGQFDHVRGWDRHGDGTFAVGRDGFVGEAMRFLDLHLRGIQPAIDDPAISVQDNFGRYRAETAWPPSDAAPFVTELRHGKYSDVVCCDTGIFSISPPLPHDVWLSGEPEVTIETTTVSPRSNLSVQLFDVAPNGAAVEVSRDAYLIRDVGASTIRFPLMGQDWIFEAGHRLAVRVSSSNTRWFFHIATGGAVEVTRAEIALPFLTAGRTAFLGGEPTQRLDSELHRTTWLPQTQSSHTPFELPGPIDTGQR